MKRISQLTSLVLRYLIGFGIVAWLLSSNQLNFSGMTSVAPRILTLALVISLLQWLMTAWRVQLLLKAQDILVGFYRCLFYNAVGMFYSTLLPGSMSGDAVRAVYFCRCHYTVDSKKTDVIGVLLIDRFIGTLIMCIVGLVAATLARNAIHLNSHLLIILWGGLVLGIGIYLWACNFYKLSTKMTTLLNKRSWIQKVLHVLQSLNLKSYSKKAIITCIVLSALIHMGAAVIVFLFASHFHSGLSFSQVMVVSPVGLLMNALPIAPGGLGVGEQCFELLFSYAGGQQGGNSFMLSRLALFAPAIVGAVFSCYSLFNRRFSVRTSPSP